MFLFKRIKVKCLPLLRGEFEYRTLITLTGAMVIAVLGVTLLIGNSIARFYFERLRSQEIEFLFRAIESGPLSFARLQSVEVSQQTLNRLMGGASEQGLGVVSIHLRGGQGLKYTYGRWTDGSRTLKPNCAVEIERNFTYPDSLNPYRVEITFDSCRVHKGASSIRKMSIFSVFFLSGIMMIGLGFLFLPLFRSIKNAEVLLKNGVRGTGLETISFLPIRRLGALAVREFQREKDLAQVRIAQQVAHDVRSPLVALEMITSQLNEWNEEKRVIVKNAIRSIRDVANLLRVTPAQAGLEGAPPAPAAPNEPVLLYPLLDELISEKRYEFKNFTGVNLEFEQNTEAYGLAAQVNSRELKRVISNLINNSVEALPKATGRVEVRLQSQTDSRVSIEVIDQGKGMAQTVLEKIGNRGVSVGKPEGSGLGLAHAKEFAAHAGGELTLTSSVGAGTRVKLILPAAQAPDWFMPELKIQSGGTLVVLDDEPTLHQMWKTRLQGLEGKPKSVELKSVMTGEQLRCLYRKEYLDLEAPVFLMDYEISGNSSQTGLDLISELGIGSQSCLVTSHYQEPSVVESCKRLGVKLIPKSMSGFVPIQVH